MVDLSIIIVSWNVAYLLKECLTSIYANREKLNIETFVVDVTDTTPPMVSLNSPANNTYTSNNVSFNFTPEDNVDIQNCSVVIDQVLNETRDVPNNQWSNITVQNISEGIHNWTINCTDLQNNSAINTTRRTFIVDITAPVAFALYRPVTGNISTNLSPVFVWNETSDTYFRNYTLQIDNDAAFGSINYQDGTSDVAARQLQITLADQTLWYWRVIERRSV